MPYVRLNKYAVILTIVTIVTVTGIYIGGYHYKFNLIIKDDFNRQFHELKPHYLSLIEARGEKLNSLLSTLINDEEFISNLADKNTNRLMEHSNEIFKQLTLEHNISLLNVHDPYRYNLVRSHAPENHGDRIDRQSILLAQRYGQITNGLEFGKNGALSLRSVAPIKIDDKLIGFIEIGEKFDSIITNLHLLYELEFIVLLDKQFLDYSNWIQDANNMEKIAEWHRFPNFVLTSNTLTNVPEQLATLFRQQRMMDSETHRLNFNKQNYLSRAFTITDTLQRNIAYLWVNRNITSQIRDLNNTLLTIIAIIVVTCTTLFSVYYIVLNQLDREININHKTQDYVKITKYDLSRRPLLLLLLTLVITISTGEFATNVLIPNGLPAIWKAILNIGLLLLLLYPILYLIVINPIAVNIQKRLHAEKTIARLGSILDRSATEVYIFDATTLKFLEVSRGAQVNLGFSMQELEKLTPIDIKPKINHDQFLKLIDPLLSKNKDELSFETVHGRKDGTTYPVEVKLIYSTDETPPVFVAIIQDISERNHYISELEHKALYDSLSGLPNRTLFQDRLKQALKVAQRESSQLSLLIINVLRLQEINNILGYKNGDIVLQEVANRLTKQLRKSDTIAHLNGTEFALILPALDLEHVSMATYKILKLFEQPIKVEDNLIEVEATIGIAMYPDHGESATILMQHSDIAMRIAKSEASGFCIYSPENDPYSLRRLRLHTELRQAINDKSLQLYYQPKIDIKSGKTISVEALARWPHAREGMIPPVEFIPMIEQTGMIKPFTLWVLEQAIIQCKLWKNSGINLNVAVNLSARNLLDSELPKNIFNLLKTHKVEEHRLTLEITESAVMSRPDKALKILTNLRSIGINISIDDYGTGYSSFAYLKKLPVTELKIDYSFVSGITTNENDAVIVRSTIDLAHNLGLKVVAEGVENKEVLDLLSILRCDQCQGYYFNRPVSSNDLEEWLKNSIWGSKSKSNIILDSVEI